MDIERDRTCGVLKLSRSGYIEKVLQVFRMDMATPVSTSLGAQFKLVSLKEGDKCVGCEEDYLVQMWLELLCMQC